MRCSSYFFVSISRSSCSHRRPRRQAHFANRQVHQRGQQGQGIDAEQDADTAVVIGRHRLAHRLVEVHGLTQREVASSFGISRSYVSRLETKALAKLREAFQERE